MKANKGYLLALNSGSSSLKLGCFERAGEKEQGVVTGSADGIGRSEGTLQLRAKDGTVLLNKMHVSETQEQALQQLSTALQQHLSGQPMAVVHRIVHGGPQLREQQRITPRVMQLLEAARHLAPLHIPQALTLIQQAEQLFPGVPQFACFDTTFHRTLPAVASHLPLPPQYFAEGVQRYGFHGLSCESVMRRLGQGRPSRLVIAHLGNGSSVTAVRDGQSVDTTMGLSPTGGIPMSTRTGDLDPAVLLYLLRGPYKTADALEHFVNHQGGLAGLSGGEADMQVLLDGEAHGSAPAALAVLAFCTAVRKAIGSYAALLGGLDLLVFTGGIGEHSAVVRGRISEGMGFLFQPGSQSQVLALPAQEELEMAYQCRQMCQAELGK